MRISEAIGFEVARRVSRDVPEIEFRVRHESRSHDLTRFKTNALQKQLEQQVAPPSTQTCLIMLR